MGKVGGFVCNMMIKFEKVKREVQMGEGESKRMVRGETVNGGDGK